MNLIGQTINGMKIVGEPQRSGIRGSNYKYPCECEICGVNKTLTLQSLRQRKTYGCGCSIDGLITKNGVSFTQWCMDNNRMDLLDLWDYGLNTSMPSQISSQSQKQRWFKCEQGKHESFLYAISSITRRPTHKYFCPKCNSFAQHLIDLYGTDALNKYWDYNKNVIDPWCLKHGSDEIIYIKCQNTIYHESYSTNAQEVLRGRGCPYCRHLKIHPSDSFAAYCNKNFGDNYIDEVWDYKKNTVNPWEIAPTSNVYVFLKCINNINHISYKTFLPNFFKTKYHCPQCALESQDSALQTKVVKYIIEKYLYPVYHEYDCSIKLKNPKTNRWLRYDNEVILPNGKHLIIEVHGMQHFIANCGYNIKRAEKLHTTTQEVLFDQQYRDNLKECFALDNGFEYLAISYTTEEDNLYKQLIDNKIQEILSQTQQNDYNDS